MSLINEALKKAQKQRENPPGAPPPAAPPPGAYSQGPSDAPRSPRRGANSNNSVLIAAAFAIVAVSVAATVYFLREPKQASLAPAIHVAQVSPSPSVNPVTPPPSAATQSATSPGSSVPATAASVRPGDTPAMSVSLPKTMAPNAGEKPVSPETSSAISTQNAAKAWNGPTPTPESRAFAGEAAPIKPTFRIQAMIDKLRISGIRLADTDSRVILNDHLFRANDVVESSLGLRLVGIEAHVLTFVDGDGNTYLKRF